MASTPTVSRQNAVASDTGRLLTYGASFVGLMGFLFGALGMVGLLLAETVFHSRNVISGADARSQGSYYLADLLVSTPIWLSFWRMAQRGIGVAPAEREASERRLFFAFTFAVTSLVVVFNVHTLLNVLVGLSGHFDVNNSLRDGVSAGIAVCVYGIAGVFYTHMAWSERPTTAWDPARDLALYVLSAVTFALAAFGAINAVGLVVDALSRRHADMLVGSTPGSVLTMWGQVSTAIIPNIAIWAGLSVIANRYRGIRPFRVPYLALLLLISAVPTIGFGSSMVYDVLRRLLGYRTDPMWGFIHDTLPVLLVAGASWAYHWRMLWDQASLDASKEQSAIPWTRRPYFALLTVVGLVAASAGAVTIVWVCLDLIWQKSTLSGFGSWRDELCTGIVLLVLGVVLWLRPWMILQAAALRDPRERGAEIRRRLLGLIVIAATLAVVGFLIAALWLMLSALLGNPHTGNTVHDTVQAFATALIAAGIVAYHGPILRSDLRFGREGTSKLRIVAMVTPNVASSIEELSRRLGRRIEIIGYIPPTDRQEPIDVQRLEDALNEIARSAIPRALVILSATGGAVYPYTRQLAGVLEMEKGPADLQIAAQGT